MKMSERLEKRLQKAKEQLDAIGKEDFAWKPRLADAVLDLVKSGKPLTIEALKERLTELGATSRKVIGTDMTIETSRMASDAAIAHLLEAAGMAKNEVDEDR